MGNIVKAALWAVGWMIMATAQAFAHFGMLIASDNMVMPDEPPTIHLSLSFSHPMEMVGMEMARPNVFQVAAIGRHEDLKNSLAPVKKMGHTAWQTRFAVQRPGVYHFHFEPQPYWEPAEDCFIIHFTKTVIAAFGSEEGWDAELGLKTEIVPLSRPFGVYAGNLFQGIVKLDGKAVPNARVEIEHYNAARIEAPTAYMVTQVTKADGNGVFSYAVPESGWWGFAALNTAAYKLKKDGRDKDVELGAVLWVHFEKWPKK
ncbi:MAG: DUF4198 domain-containing protein [Desulfobacteraceae bacterium]|nr:MAG: DUF4198 domain-containing protein [Desulfobacteraceae bacterium]